MAKVISSLRTIGDAVKWVDHPAYNYVGTRHLKNATGADLENAPIVAQPVKLVGDNWEFVVAGDEAATDGILMDQKRITLANDAVSVEKYNVLVRGPAIVNKDGLPEDDVEGVALDHDAIQTAIEALNPPIICVVSPVTKETQVY